MLKDLIICLSIILGIYGISGILLGMRSQTAIISARSNRLLFVILLGNWLETSFMIMNIFSDSLNLNNKQDHELWLITMGVGISHFILYFPYLLRAYRICLIFSMEENLENYVDSIMYHRTTQSWLLRCHILLCMPIVSFYLIVTSLVYTNSIQIIYNPASPDATTSIYTCIIIFFRFSEHLGLIIANYLTRWAINDFNMTRELSLVAIDYSRIYK